MDHSRRLDKPGCAASATRRHGSTQQYRGGLVSRPRGRGTPAMATRSVAHKRPCAIRVPRDIILEISFPRIPQASSVRRHRHLAMTLPSRDSITTPTRPTPAKAPGAIRRAAARVFGVLYGWAESGWSRSAVGAWAFLQSSVVPGPSDALIVPLGLADPKKSFDLAVWAIIGAVLGALVAYAIGALAFEQLGAPLLGFLGVGEHHLGRVNAMFAEKGWLVVMLGSLPLLSTKAVCIAAGAFGVPLPEFTLAILATRGARFLLTALLLRFAGTQIARWIEGKFQLSVRGIGPRR